MLLFGLINLFVSVVQSFFKVCYFFFEIFAIAVEEGNFLVSILQIFGGHQLFRFEFFVALIQLLILILCLAE
jgi:hypothetical protein